MSGFFSRKSQKRRADEAAFDLGRRTGQNISNDIDLLVNKIVVPKRDRFLSVFQQRLDDIVEIEGVPFVEQARIEQLVLLENWNERKSEQESEIWTLLSQKWGKETLAVLKENKESEISSAIAQQYIDIFGLSTDRIGAALEKRKA